MQEAQRDDEESLSDSPCCYCQAEVPDHAWFGLEVQRPVTNPTNEHDIEYRDAVFCSQEHAARWLETPLDPPAPTPQFAGSGRTAGVLLGCAALALAIALGVGVFTIVRWLLSFL